MVTKFRLTHIAIAILGGILFSLVVLASQSPVFAAPNGGAVWVEAALCGTGKGDCLYEVTNTGDPVTVTVFLYSFPEPGDNPTITVKIPYVTGTQYVGTFDQGMTGNWQGLHSSYIVYVGRMDNSEGAVGVTFQPLQEGVFTWTVQVEGAPAVYAPQTVTLTVQSPQLETYLPLVMY